ncbi:MAG: chromate efflux transporter [Syntrophomonadaceae bacterium]|jgi:chromate transporter|nr:chromate efflux transporter [Syntrophomonadaceae bacterium]MDH7498468.1 chromate efflux transporter [Syntrophomonadaceae bacterium]
MEAGGCEPATVSAPSVPRLFAAFAWLGMAAFGGPAIIGHIHRAVVQRYRWLDELTFGDGLALCQFVPGATAMQLTAYVGLRLRGLAGAGAAFVGFGLPPFLIMLVLSSLYVQGSQLPAVKAVFAGLQAVVVALVVNAALVFGRSTVRARAPALVALASALLYGTGTSPVLVIVAAGAVGALLLPPRTVPSPGRPAPPGGDWRAVAAVGGLGAAALALLRVLDPGLYGLAAVMAEINLFAFGGGFAALPLMHYELVETRQWLDSATLLNGIALGQVTPGPIVITATFVGFVLRGWWGAVVATVGMFLPSFLVLAAVVPWFDRLRAWPRFDAAMQGAVCSFVGLLVSVSVTLAAQIPWDAPRLVLAVAALVALRLGVEVLVVAVAGGLAGWLWL